MNNLEKELYEIQGECIRINNMLITPLQNNMTEEKEKALRMKLKFLYKKEEKIYEQLIKEMGE